MIEFVFLILHRVLSGVQNAFLYANKTAMKIISTIALVGSSGLAVYLFLMIASHSDNSMPLVATILAMISMISSILLIVTPKKQIHFWEYIITGSMVLAWVFAGANIILIACSLYLGLYFHKGIINVGSGKPWHYEGTDDKTGKTFTIYIPSWLKWLITRESISIARNPLKIRIGLAVTSLVVVVLSITYNWNITI